MKNIKFKEYNIEFARKCEENETAINRRIMHAISLLKTSVKEE